jgi:hypothetical protein
MIDTSDEMVSIPSEAREQIEKLVKNGVFKDPQDFVNIVVPQFLSGFDHAKVDPSAPIKSRAKFRVTCESMADLIKDLRAGGVKGHFDVVHVGYEKVGDDEGDYYMYHMPNGVLNMIFEVDIYEDSKNFIDGNSYVYFKRSQNNS